MGERKIHIPRFGRGTFEPHDTLYSPCGRRLYDLFIDGTDDPVNYWEYRDVLSEFKHKEPRLLIADKPEEVTCKICEEYLFNKLTKRIRNG